MHAAHRGNVTAMKTLYTSVAMAEGGRTGRARTLNGTLDVNLERPVETGGSGEGTNPEELFAAGYAACFHSAMQLVARGTGQDVADSSVTAEVSLVQEDAGSYGLAVRLIATAPKLDRAQLEDLLAQTHEVCPYSRATRGHIDVELVVE